jgi:hypothetical protein
MKNSLPKGAQIITLILRAARGTALSDESLKNTVLFECSVGEGGAVILPREQVAMFAQRVDRAHARLLRAGLLHRPAPGLSQTTALGIAYLEANATRLDRQTLKRLKADPPRICPDYSSWTFSQGCTPQPPDGREDPVPEHHPPSSLESNLVEAGLNFERQPEDVYQVSFEGRLRSWCVRLKPADGKLLVRAHLLRVPRYSITRASMLEYALRLHGEFQGPRFCLEGKDSLALCCELPLETTTDPTRLRHAIVETIHKGEAVYPKLLELAKNGDALQNLEAAFKKSP